MFHDYCNWCNTTVFESIGPAVSKLIATPEDRRVGPGTFDFLQRYIRREAGIVIEADQHYLLESRLTPLLALPELATEHIDTLEALCHRLSTRSSAHLAELVLDAMTTNETFFFRDAAMFEALRVQVLPEMLERTRGQRKLRIWSAAASTGQEAYSLAILLRELGASAKDVEILGTDISLHVLERARAGLYLPFEVHRGLSKTLLDRYFKPVAANWLIDESVRTMVTFEQMDLRRNVSRLGRFDLILCRNVLIYFDTETKKRVIDAIYPMLSPRGKLVLGCAETIINICNTLHPNTVGQSTFYSL